MAIAARVLVQVFLVVFFCREVIRKRLYLNRNAAVVSLLQAGQRLFDHRQIVCIGVIDSRPVLTPDVAALPVERQRIDRTVV